ncbi:hypothetical protein BZG36_05091 [Bifiguratus adelaidae]|uniref:Uncharacterized protein n=1 Tax=Bifiguratus adelaidae TaxID=1938954 RepID=A0A261XWB6_9FUNG|nr:hypothetical protein BZG36_05091 [Bifiguratus adelaidae]
MDELVLAAQEEVALDGLNGTDLARFWSLLRSKQRDIAQECIDARRAEAQRDPEQEPVEEEVGEFDVEWKAYFWQWVQAVGSLSLQKRGGKNDSHHPVSGWRRKTYTSLLEDGEEADYRLVSDEETRKMVVMGDSTQTLSAVTYQYLDLITRAREAGIAQTDLTKELGHKPVMAHHHVKSLIKAGLIVKTPVVFHGVFTSILINARFSTEPVITVSDDEDADTREPDFDATDYKNTASENQHSTGINVAVIRKRVLDLLTHATNHIMTIGDICEALGFDQRDLYQRRWFVNRLTLMEDKGILRKIFVPQEGGGQLRCVQLVKSANSKDEDYETDALEDESTMLADVPYQMQIFNLIKESGLRGITVMELRSQLNKMGTRYMMYALEKLKTPAPKGYRRYQLYHSYEMAGKERRLRFYCREAWKVKMHELERTEALLSSDAGSDVETEVDWEQSAPSMKTTAPQRPPRPTQGRGRPRKDGKPVGSVPTKKRPRPTEIQGEPSVPRKRGRPRKDGSQGKPPPKGKKSSATNQPESSSTPMANDSQVVAVVEPAQSGDGNELISIPSTVDVSSAPPAQPSESFAIQSTIDGWLETLPREPMENIDVDTLETMPSTERSTEQPSQASEAADETFTVDAMEAPTPSPTPCKRQPKPRKEPKMDSKQTSGTKSKAREGAKYNATYEKRKNTILEVLARERIIDVTASFITRLEDRIAELTGEVNPYRMDRKTVVRTSETMHESKLLQVLRVHLDRYSKDGSTRFLLIHNDLPVDGPEVQGFIELLRERAIFGDIRLTRAQKTVERVNVDRLSDLRRRWIGAEGPGSEGSDNEQADNSTVPKETSWWMTVAQDFGFVNARMKRAKLMHQFIIQMMAEPQIVERRIDTEKRIFYISHLVESLPLRLYLQCLGHNHRSEDLTSFIENGGNLNTPLKSLPQTILLEIKKANKNLKTHIKTLLNTLHTLSLIEPTESRDTESMAFQMDPITGYEVPLQVPLYDLSDGGRSRRVVRQCRMETSDDFMTYWADLYNSVSTEWSEEEARQARQANGQPKPREKRFPTYASPQALKGPLGFVLNPRNWVASYTYSRSQRMILRTYHKFFNNINAFDPSLIDEISRLTGLLNSRIRHYYEARYKAKIAHKQLSARSRRRYMVEDDRGAVANRNDSGIGRKAGKQAGGQTSVDKDGVTPSSSAAEGTSTSRGEEAGSSVTLEDMYEEPYKEAQSRTRQRNWTAEEDEIVKLGSVILRHCSPKAATIWKPMEVLLPHRSSTEVRRRRLQLRHDREYVKQEDTLADMFHAVYQQGTAAGEIVANVWSDRPDFDMMGIYRYFKTHLDGMTKAEIVESAEASDSRTQKLILPADISLLHELFRVEKSSQESATEEILDERTWTRGMTHKRELLEERGLTVLVTRSLHTALFESRESENLEYERLSMLCKMILLTPDEDYSNTSAYELLKRYPLDHIEEACRISHERGIMVRIKSGNDRRIPGRGYTLSEKFVEAMEGTFMNRKFPQATIAHNKLSVPSVLARVLSDGSVAAILNVISTGAVQAEFMDLHQVFKNKSFFVDYRAISKIEDTELELDVRLLPRATMTTFDLAHILPPHVGVPPNTFQRLTHLKQTTPTVHDRLHLDIYKTLQQAKEAGMTFEKLLAKLPSGQEHYKQTVHKHLLKMQSECPPLPWLVPTTLSATAEQNDHNDPSMEHCSWKDVKALWNASQEKAKPSAKKAPSEPAWAYVPGRMWIDINGRIIAAVFRGCMETVLDTILARPGITKGAIYEKLKVAMTWCEIEEVLEVLLQRNAIRVQKYVARTKVTLFSWPRQIKLDDAADDDKSYVSYWALPDYYLKTFVK